MGGLYGAAMHSLKKKPKEIQVVKNRRRCLKNRRGNANIYRSMAVVVDDGLWMSLMAVIHNTGHWEFLKFNELC